MIGGIIMTHGDDIGLLPPRVAPIQVVIVPIWKKDEQKESVMAAALQVGLKKTDVCVKLDATEKKTPGWKFNFWEMEGVPSKIRLVHEMWLRIMLSLHEEKYQARKTRNLKYVHLISQVHLYM
jgi:prolyl-tRNA synthetase